MELWAWLLWMHDYRRYRKHERPPMAAKHVGELWARATALAVVVNDHGYARQAAQVFAVADEMNRRVYRRAVDDTPSAYYWIG